MSAVVDKTKLPLLDQNSPAFCVGGDARVMMSDMSCKSVQDLKVGDSVISMQTVPSRTFNSDTDIDAIQETDDFSTDIKKALKLLSDRRSGFEITVPEKCQDLVTTSKITRIDAYRYTGKLYTLNLAAHFALSMTPANRIASIHEDVEELGIKRFYPVTKMSEDMLVLTLEVNTNFNNQMQNCSELGWDEGVILDAADRRSLSRIQSIQCRDVENLLVYHIETEAHTFVANGTVVHD